MTSEREVHRVFINDPIQHHSMIHCQVKVTTACHKQYTGWVHTIDPVSESVVLVEFDDDGGKEVILVAGYNIKDITILDSNPPAGLATTIDNIFRKEQVEYSNQELTSRRESLCVWLAENRVPYTVKEDMSIQVLQAAVIAPPYEPGSVHCTNEVVLDKVMKLVQQVPVSGPTAAEIIKPN